MNELKPCPFCGNEDVKIEYIETEYFMYCLQCEMDKTLSGNECDSNRQEAIKQWNTRIKQEG